MADADCRVTGITYRLLWGVVRQTEYQIDIASSEAIDGHAYKSVLPT